MKSRDYDSLTFMLIEYRIIKVGQIVLLVCVWYTGNIWILHLQIGNQIMHSQYRLRKVSRWKQIQHNIQNLSNIMDKIWFYMLISIHFLKNNFVCSFYYADFSIKDVYRTMCTVFPWWLFCQIVYNKLIQWWIFWWNRLKFKELGR